MKTLDIAWKDLRHSFRSAFALVFMFVVPLMTVGLFYLAFGGVASDGEPDLATIEVQVVNLDQPASQADDFSAGETLTEFLASEELAELLNVTRVEDALEARAAVDGQRAAVAVIIPSDFTAAMVEPEGRAAVELYRDPTLQIGPDVVKSVVSQFIDGFAGSEIASDVVDAQLTRRGVTVDARLQQEIMVSYARWSAELGQRRGEGGASLVDVRSVGKAEGESQDPLMQILRPIMTGMMIFYAFFTAANSARSILDEEEAGTLSRLFTTPTAVSTILAGKVLAVFATLVVQVAVLVAFGAVILGMSWGAPLPVGLAALGLVVLASSFGIFLTSLLENTDQVGIVFGGVMTVTGMVGINAMFTGNLTGTSGATDLIALFTPQGWAMRGWRVVLQGGGVADLLLVLGVMVALSVVFFTIGVRRFERRFA